jgi:conjugative relaxase-like TrwC/TraI family protein
MKPMKVSATKATEYYYQADPLYSLDVDHKWIGEGAKNLGLEGKIDYEKFTNLLNGMSPDGTLRLAGRESDHGKYAAVDMPISIPKSFSILAMLDPKFRTEMTKTLISSAGNVEDYTVGRQTANGVTEQVKGGMIGAAFVHSTSRAGDPNFHCHTVICNVVQRPDGSFSTLENREIFKNQSEHQQRVYSDLAAMAHKMGLVDPLVKTIIH